MNRRGFLRALLALPGAAALAPLLKLVSEAEPVMWPTPNYDAFHQAAVDYDKVIALQLERYRASLPLLYEREETLLTKIKRRGAC